MGRKNVTGDGELVLK